MFGRILKKQFKRSWRKVDKYLIEQKGMMQKNLSAYEPPEKTMNTKLNENWSINYENVCKSPH